MMYDRMTSTMTVKSNFFDRINSGRIEMSFCFDSLIRKLPGDGKFQPSDLSQIITINPTLCVHKKHRSTVRFDSIWLAVATKFEFLRNLN